jgi:hypothetical protein
MLQSDSRIIFLAIGFRVWKVARIGMRLKPALRRCWAAELREVSMERDRVVCPPGWVIKPGGDCH